MSAVNNTTNLIIKRETLIDIADAVRSKTGKADEIQVGQLASEIDGIVGGDGIALPSLTNPADASEVFLGKEYIDAEGTAQTGAFTIESELSEQSTLLNTLQSALANKGAADVSAIQEDYLAAVANKELTEIVNHKMTGQLYNAFQRDNKNLVRVDLPLITSIGEGSFNDCNKLIELNLPAVTSMGASNFEACHGLPVLYFPSLQKITSWGFTFNACTGVTKAYFPALTEISSPYCFGICIRMKAFILGADTVCTLSETSVFNQTPIAGYTNSTNGEMGYIYVPAALVDQYKTATNWSAFADQFRAIEDYPDITEGFE